MDVAEPEARLPLEEPRERYRRPLAQVGIACVLFAAASVHFRPWELGLLEDWQFALGWDQSGWASYLGALPGTIGRPLHLLPTYLGLATGSTFVGMYLVLAVAAVGQLLGVIWAGKGLPVNRLLVWLAGLTLALHPWWPAGDILRFLPAQVSATLFVISAGFAIRFARGRGLAALIGFVGFCIAGLLTYQALAATYVVLAAVLVVLVPMSSKRAVALVASSVGAVTLVLVYSVVLAPRMAPGSYESQFGYERFDPVATVKAIGRTILTDSPALLASLVAIIIGTILLMVLRLITRKVGIVALCVVLVSPAAALAYAASPYHLNDPERLAFPVGTTAWIAIFMWSMIVAPAAGRRVVIALIAVAAAIAAALGAIVGLYRWSDFAETQAHVLEFIRPSIGSATPGQALIVEDGSGSLGDVYTFLPPHLEYAAALQFGKYVPITLCTADGVSRHHTDAQRFPIGTTVACSEVEGMDSATLIGEGSLNGSPVRVYATGGD